jgi:hypothetical protein
MTSASYTAYRIEADGLLGEMFSCVPGEPVAYEQLLGVGGREAVEEMNFWRQGWLSSW